MPKPNQNRKLAYTEGDWFAVPLRSGGFAPGIIARQSSNASLLGYFFGPKADSVPTLEDLKNLRPENAVLIEMFGDLGLIKGKWPIIGALPFSRADWPMPKFVRKDLHTNETYLIQYDDRDAGLEIAARLATTRECAGLPEDGLSGYGAIEIRLTKILSSPSEGALRNAKYMTPPDSDLHVVSGVGGPMSRNEEQAVLIHLGANCGRQGNYSPTTLAPLERALTKAIEEKNVGEFDGDEFGLQRGEVTLYMYGPNAEALFAAIEEILRGSPLCQGARIVLRKGGPGSPQREIRI